MNSQSIISGLHINSQIPLDSKAYFLLLSELGNLGNSNEKAFHYYEGFTAYCNQNKLEYVWREYKTEEETGGVINNGFIYPQGSVSNEVSYSGRKFNFFLKSGNEISQNNTISTFYTDSPDELGTESVAEAFNSSSTSVVVESTEILVVINSYQKLVGNSSYLHTDYYFLKLGKGVYGNNSDIVLNDSDFVFYRKEEPNIIVSTSPPKIEVIIVPDNTLNVFSIVNESTQEFIIEDEIDTFFVIKNEGSTDSSTNKTYRFVGNSGSYGSGELDSLPNDFLEITNNTNIPEIVENNRLDYGGVIHAGGLDFENIDSKYFLNNQEYYVLAGQQVTLSDGHSEFDRFDVFVLDSNGTLIVVEGDPSDNPFKPGIDLTSQVEIGFLLVNANSTEVNPPDTTTLVTSNTQSIENLYDLRKGNIPITNYGDLPNVAFTENDEPQPLIDALNALPLQRVPHGWIGMFSTVRITATSPSSFIADKRFYVFSSPLPGVSDSDNTYYGQGSGTALNIQNTKFKRFERLTITVSEGIVAGTGSNPLGVIEESEIANAINNSQETYVVNNGFILFDIEDQEGEKYFYLYTGSEEILGNGGAIVSSNEIIPVNEENSNPIASDLSVRSVNGRRGNVLLTRDDVGLSDVDNTSDEDKPVSILQQAALNALASLIPESLEQLNNDGEDFYVRASQRSTVPPNTIIGNMGSVWPTKADLAGNLKTISSSGSLSSFWTADDIEKYLHNFKVVGNDIHCVILKDYGFTNGIFYSNGVGSVCTYYNDIDGHLKSVNFKTNPEIEDLKLNGLVSINGTFENCPKLKTFQGNELTTVFHNFRGNPVFEKAIVPKLRTLYNGFTGTSTPMPDVIDRWTFPELDRWEGQDGLRYKTTTHVDIPTLRYMGAGLLRFATSVLEWKTPAVEEIGGGCFYGMSAVTVLDFPICTSIAATAGNTTFWSTDSLTLLNIPKCTVFGEGHDTDNGFWNKGLSQLTINAHISLKTANNGSPNANLAAAASRGATINYVSDDTIVEIQNELGETQYTSDKLKFSGFDIDPVTETISASSNTTSTYFVNSEIGDDSTGTKDNPKKPFATLDAALTYYKATEPLVNDNNSNFYVFNLVGSAGYKASQRLIQAVDSNISGIKKGTNILITSSDAAELTLEGSSSISCFLANEGQDNSSQYLNSQYNSLEILLPFGTLTLTGDSSIGFATGNSFSHNQVNICVSTFTHSGSSVICSLVKEGYGFIAKKFVISSSATTILFDTVENRKNIELGEVIATSSFTLTKYFRKDSILKFDSIESDSDFTLTTGFAGQAAGTIIHGDVNYTGGTVGMFYLYTGGGSSELKLHFPRKATIRGDVRISGNSSNANIIFSGEQAIYQDCTRLFNQLDYFSTKGVRIFFQLKKIFILGEVGGSSINVGMVLTNCYLELGGLVASSPTAGKATLHTEDFDIITIEGSCVIKTNLGSGFAVTSGDQVNGTSVKIKINGDLLMLGGSIEETANLEVIKDTNINRY